MTTTALPHALDRTIVIRATPDTVFRFFTDPARWAAWWGAGSTIDAVPGGAVRIRYPDGTEVLGEVVELAAPERLVFTYGYARGKPIDPGASLVTIRLSAHAGGTEVHVTHAFGDPAVRDLHVQGWRYQLSVFSNVVADEVNHDAADAVDAWFSAWSIADDREREHTLAAAASPHVQFRDRFSAVDGLPDLIPHIAAAQRFMPGLSLRRHGHVRHCQGTVLADWIAVAPDGQQRGAGTNVFEFGADGRIGSVIGFWNA